MAASPWLSRYWRRPARDGCLQRAWQPPRAGWPAADGTFVPSPSRSVRPAYVGAVAPPPTIRRHRVGPVLGRGRGIHVAAVAGQAVTPVQDPRDAGRAGGAARAAGARGAGR